MLLVIRLDAELESGLRALSEQAHTPQYRPPAFEVCEGGSAWQLPASATALRYGHVMVTANSREFGRIDGLLIEVWTSQT